MCRMSRLVSLVLIAAPVFGTDHPPATPGTHNEHLSALALCDAGDATHTAIANGDWSDPKTWADGVPTAGSRVFIPECIAVTLSRELLTDIDWVRVEGTLRFATDSNTKLRVSTILVPGTGLLQIGSKTQPVLADRTANVVFLPRSKGHRANDPFDLSGGLIALGQVQIFGSDYRGFALPKEILYSGTRTLTLDEAPKGWKAGDELLFPATVSASEDERRTISSVSADAKTFTLAVPLSSNHLIPEGITCKVPVGNLTRNVILSSAEPGVIAHRGHVMFMAHEGVQISGAMFRGLGRTRTEKIHSIPDRDDEGKVSTGDNLIGRYAVHFHLRGGARIDRPAQQFTGNVIVDSPKHGLVNHGGHVVAENNVTYAIHGSHFMSENGCEIGAFRDNLAVYSRGSGDKIRARECLFDFGHGGHGFWAQSPGVLVEGNYAFHHADAAFGMIILPVKEFGKPIRFARHNVPAEWRGEFEDEQFLPQCVPFRFVRNMGGNSGRGLEVWNANTFARHNHPSLVADCQFWETPLAGIDIPYTHNIVIRDTIAQGRLDARYRVIGLHLNTSTRFVTLERVTVAGFNVGLDVPDRGHTLVENCRFDNDINIRVFSPVQPNRRTVLRNNSFVRRNRFEVDYYLSDPDCKFNGDLSLLFQRDVLLVEDARFPGQTVYFAEQDAEATLNRVTDVEQLRGKTAREVWQKMGLAISGSLAPEGAIPLPRIRGLVGPITAELHRGLEETTNVTFLDDKAKYTKTGDEYTVDQNLDRVRFVKAKPGEKSGWRFETTIEGDQPRTKMTYVDASAPHFELATCMKLHIHPDDVKHGIEICGILHDDVAGKPTIKNMIKEMKNLTVDPDGYVTVNYCCADSVGNTTEHTFRFEVTEDAPRRGKNIAYYNQKEYMPPEEEPVVVEAQPVQRSWLWAWLAGVGVALCFAGVGGKMAWQRKIK